MHNKCSRSTTSRSSGPEHRDEYFELKHDAVFIDFDMLALGPVVRDVSDSFDEYWNSEFTEQLSGWSPFDRDEADLASLRASLLELAAANQETPYALRLQGADFIKEAADDELSLIWHPPTPTATGRGRSSRARTSWQSCC